MNEKVPGSDEAFFEEMRVLRDQFEREEQKLAEHYLGKLRACLGSEGHATDQLEDATDIVIQAYGALEELNEKEEAAHTALQKKWGVRTEASEEMEKSLGRSTSPTVEELRRLFTRIDQQLRTNTEEE